VNELPYEHADGRPTGRLALLGAGRLNHGHHWTAATGTEPTRPGPGRGTSGRSVATVRNGRLFRPTVPRAGGTFEAPVRPFRNGSGCRSVPGAGTGGPFRFLLPLPLALWKRKRTRRGTASGASVVAAGDAAW